MQPDVLIQWAKDMIAAKRAVVVSCGQDSPDGLMALGAIDVLFSLLEISENQK